MSTNPVDLPKLLHSRRRSFLRRMRIRANPERYRVMQRESDKRYLAKYPHKRKAIRHQHYLRDKARCMRDLAFRVKRREAHRLAKARWRAKNVERTREAQRKYAARRKAKCEADPVYAEQWRRKVRASAKIRRIYKGRGSCAAS